MRRMRRLFVALTMVAAGVVVGQTIAPAPVSAAETLAPDLVGTMTITPVLNGLAGASVTPVGVRFAPDGRIYVAIKEGLVRMYDGPGDTTHTTALDIRTVVNTTVDRGLLGIALDPAFTSGRPYMYVLYTYDREPFGPITTVPRWSDLCPSPPGPTTDGCTVSARLDRYTVNAAGVTVGAPVRLLDGADGSLGGWCSQFPSHSIGSIDFGDDGMLYVGSGDGASYNVADYGQLGGSGGSPTPPNPCDDKQGTDPRTGGRGTALTMGTSRGGALRSQAVRGALANEYITWDGSIMRIDPDTGAAATGNPLIGNGIAGDDRIVAYGLRNPYRFTLRPGTSELWLGEVGWNTWEEVNSFTTGPSQTTVPNFGWPCYEGSGVQSVYQGLSTSLCDSLYAANTSSLGGVSSPLVAPKYSWRRFGQASALPCSTSAGGGAATGGGFVTNAMWPAALNGTYVFGDYSRRCLMAMPLDGSGQPDAGQVRQLVYDTYPVDIKVGPGGDIYWIDIVTGRLNRLRPISGNIEPVASFTASPDNGPLPLVVQFDASSTTDPNGGEVLTYTWDLDGDGACDDGGGVATPTISRSYPTAAIIDVKLCVTDQLGLTASTIRQIQPGNSRPVIQTLTTSADSGGWKVGDTVTFSATATDVDEVLPASAYTWEQSIRHCESPSSTACHVHGLTPIEPGQTGAVSMPDHDFYASVLLTLSVTDFQGLVATRTVDLTPRISTVTLQTEPAGITVSVGSQSGTSPLTASFLEGGLAQLTVPNTVNAAGFEGRFLGWSDSPTASSTRLVNAPPGSTTYTARYDSNARIQSVSPVRLLDTRDGTGAPAGQLGAGASLRLQVIDSAAAPAGTIPAGTVAVVVNLTAVGAPSPGHVTAYPCGEVPVVSNLNISSAEPVANLVTVPLDADGGLCLSTFGPTDLIVDLAGVVTPALGPGDAYTGITPKRVVDTREGFGLPQRQLAAGEIVEISLLPAGVPADATAVMANITVTNPAAAGFVTAFPCGGAAPLASNLNYVAGQTVSNLALTFLGDNHALCLTSLVPTDIVIDVAGWLAPAGSTALLIRPERVLDTRLDGTRLAAGATVMLDAVDIGAPSNAVALIANVTAVDTAAPGFLTVYPCDAGRPFTSNVNYGAGEARPGLTVTTMGGARSVCIYSLASVDVVVDVQGWMVNG